jgi:hypothetical protein
MTHDATPGNSADRAAAIYATAGHVARRLRKPLPTVMTAAVRQAASERVPVDDVLRRWANTAQT